MRVREAGVAALLALLLAAAGTVQAGDRVSGKPWVGRSEVIAPSAMVASSHPLATQVGLSILRSGGNAVDAAIAVNAALAVMEPTGCGIGGDLLAIVWDAKTGRLHGLNATGRAPRAANREWFLARGYDRIPSYGPLTVTVPGVVDGWFRLHERFGSRPMVQLLQPAIDYARRGHPVHEVIAHYWQGHIEKRAPYPGYLEQMTIDGRAPRKGELWRNPNLANTLERIAREGREVFYEGEIARAIARFMQEHGGFLDFEDLATHEGHWVEPVSTHYRGYDVWELPPNSQGIAVLQMLNILEGFDIAAMGFGSADYLHTLVEAKKLVYEDRARFYADPDFNHIPVADLISKPYADQRRKRIDPERSATVVPPGDPGVLRDGDTVYFTTADAAGNMVSMIQSNWRGSGSGMTPPGLGFVLQNRGEVFSLDPEHANRLEPGKRPFHTNIPAFITRDGQPFMTLGVMGGEMQPQGHVQVIVNLLDFGMNLQEAGDAPRIRHTGSSEPDFGEMIDGGRVNLESGFDYAVVRELMRRGHAVELEPDNPYGGYQAIQRDPVSGVYFGASESRKDGQAAGY